MNTIISFIWATLDTFICVLYVHIFADNQQIAPQMSRKKH